VAPFSVFSGDGVTPEFEAQYLRACRLAHLIEPPVYLGAMLHDFLTAGGQLVVREIRDQAELMSLPEPVMFNCTGLAPDRCSRTRSSPR
jgi:hypothetical protein